MSLPSRFELIQAWLGSVLPAPHFQLEPASSDASFRRYYRVSQKSSTWIVMDAPPEFEQTAPFIDIAQFFLSHGINVPEIYAYNSLDGLILLSDFGSDALLKKLNADTADNLYQSAINTLIDIQKCPLNGHNFLHYDRLLLAQEMRLFSDWFLNKHLAIETPGFLDDIYDMLIVSAIEQPQVIVHRDYHSRNLMCTPHNLPGVIDFQDAVIGPITYDLVSLLRDCYIEWPQQKIDQWINYYYGHAQQQGLMTDISIEQFIKWFDWMGLQRHLKVLGIFSRLNYRDQKTNYMNDIPLTLNYVRKVINKYNEFNLLKEFIDNQPKLVTIE